jgi:hypothetical protein
MNEKLKEFLNSKEKLKIIKIREHGKKTEMPKPEREIIYIDEK